MALQPLGDEELIQPELPLRGEVEFDPALPLVEVTASVYVGEELVAESALLDLPTWELGEGTFAAVMALPATLPTNEYTLVVSVSDGVRSVSSEPQTFMYRVPTQPQLSLESPVPGRTYYSTVSIEGTFSVDPALVPQLRAVLQSLTSDEQLEVPLTVEGQSFSASVAEPGAYELTVSLSDGRSNIQERVEFEYVEPLIEVVVDHDYPINEEGFAEIAGEFGFTADIEANFAPQPETFVLEQQVSGVWLPLAEFAADDVWSVEEQVATLTYDFNESSYGFNDYRLRLRVELQDGLSGASELFLVRYAPVAPTLVVNSPEIGGTYYRDVTVSGSATWDPALSGSVSAVLERGDGEVSVPLEISGGDFVGTITNDTLSVGENILRVRVQDSYFVTAEESISFNYQVPLLTASFTAPVASGEFEILQPSADLAGRITSATAFPLENVNLRVQPVEPGGELVEIPLLVNGDPQIDGWNLQTGEFSLVLELAQYDLGPGLYELVIQAQDSFPQEAESAAIQLLYREPDRLDLSISSPREGTYFEPVQIAGSVIWDPALELQLTATLDNLADTLPAQDLPLTRNNQTFTGTIGEPGQYELTVRASDSLDEIVRTVNFVYIDPVVEVEIDHQHSLNNDESLDIIDEINLRARVSNEPGVPLTGFALEARLEGSWEEIASYTLESVWNSETSTALLSFDFSDGDWSYGDYELRVRVDYQGQRSAESNVLVAAYRATEPLRLELESPTAEGLYFGPVPVEGVASADRLLTLELSATLERLAAEQEPESIALGREGDSFFYSITGPGDYRLTVVATDGRETLRESREFTLVDDQLNVSVSHMHLLTPDGSAIDLVDELVLTATVTADERIPLRGFALEVLSDNQWQTLATYPVAQVWNPTDRTAVLSYDFGEDAPFGQYQLRVRVDYADTEAASEALLVNYRGLIPPSIEVLSPRGVQAYPQSVEVSGMVEWDPVRGAPALAAHWSLQTEGDPVSGVIPLGVEDGGFSGVLSLPAQGSYRLFVRLTDRTGATWDSETVDFRSATEFSLQITSPVFEETPAIYVLPQVELAGTLTYDPAAAPDTLQLNVVRDDEVVVAEYDLLTEEIWNPANGSFSYSVPLREFGPGRYVLRLIATDTVGRDADAEVDFSYQEPERPVITVDSVPSPVIGDVTISGSVSWDERLGELGVERVWADLYFSANNSQLVEQIPLSIRDSEFAGTVSSTLMPEDGDYRLVVQAIDITGTEADAVVLDFEHLQSDKGLYMPLDGLVEGALPDLDGFNNVGKLTGPSDGAFAVGVIDQAALFDAERYVEIADQNEVDIGTGDFSIFVWVKTTRTDTIQSLLEKRAQSVSSVPGYTFYLDDNGAPSLQMMSEVSSGLITHNNYESSRAVNGLPAFVADGLWHHIGVTVNRRIENGVRLYVDGQVVATFTSTRHIGSLRNDVALSIGRHASNSGNYFDGHLDDLVLAKRALNETEIQELISRAAINVPQQPVLTLTSPTSGTYSGSVNIAGSYSTDPALTPIALEIRDAAGASLPLEFDIDPNAATGEFNVDAGCSVFSVGAHSLQARLTDSLEQTLLSEPVAFEFRLPRPTVNLELNNIDRSGIYIYGRAAFTGCPLDSDQSPQIRVIVNEQPVNVDVVSGQLPGDFIFGVGSEFLQEGNNVVQVEVVDPRDPEAVGSATINVPFESAFALTIANPAPGTTLAGHVQVYGYFTGALGPVNLYSELNGNTFIEDIAVDGNQTFSFTIPAEFLQSADQHVLSLRAFDQGTQQQAETKTEFFYTPGGELTPGGDLLVINDMEALSLEENRPWFLNWVDFGLGFDGERKNAVMFSVSESTCTLADDLNGSCARAKVVLSELYQEQGYGFSVVERAAISEIPPDIKVLILFLPDVEFNEKEIRSIKNFAATGGRVVYIGESSTCADCYSELAQQQFFQQMGVDIQQARGPTDEQFYKPNGEPHQLTAGIDVIGVDEAGVFVVDANVVPLAFWESNQAIAAVAKINTNPYEVLQIGIDSPREGGSYNRAQLPPLTGFIEQSDLSSGRPIITATIRSSASRLPEVIDVSDCWLTGCVIPSNNLWDENTIDVRAVTPFGYSAIDSVSFFLAPEVTLIAEAADGSAYVPVMGDVRLNISSNVPLDRGQVLINQIPVQDLDLSSSQAPYEYSQVVSEAHFVSGVNSIQVDLYTSANAYANPTANLDYLSTKAEGIFTFGLGIGRGVTINSSVHGTLHTFPAGVSTGTLPLSALYINGERSAFGSSRLSPSIGGTSLSYSIPLKTIFDHLGNEISSVLNLTAYVGGEGRTLSGETIIFAHRSPGARYPDAQETREILHLSVDGHGLMAGTTSGSNLFNGGGGGNQTIIGGNGANVYYFDATSGVDVIRIPQQSITSGSNLLRYSSTEVTGENLRFGRVQGTNDLIIGHAKLPAVWQVFENYFGLSGRPINNISAYSESPDAPPYYFVPSVNEIDQYAWTGWLDRDNVSGNGDSENLADLIGEGYLSPDCTALAIEAREIGVQTVLRPGDIALSPQITTFDTASGFVCLNNSPGDDSCADYEVRFLCPYQQPIVR